VSGDDHDFPLFVVAIALPKIASARRARHSKSGDVAFIGWATINQHR